MNSLIIVQLSAFLIATSFLILISRKSLSNPKHHGFYRFFTFEYVVILVIINAPYWFLNPFSSLQIISWIFLFFSLIVVIQAFYLLKKKGKHKSRDQESANYAFENTINLVDTGIYGFIRHPLYCSLILGAIGALLKSVTPVGIILTVLTIVFAFAASKTEERENILFFGSAYKDYMKRTKMFFPYIY